jgi:predicted nucleic acid-binding protein
MPPKTKTNFSNAHQDRSKKTLDDLLQAAYDIVEASDPDEFPFLLVFSQSNACAVRSSGSTLIDP